LTSDITRLANKFEANAGEDIEINVLYRVFKYKKIENIHLVKGDVNRTIPKYVMENPALKIALLHIDVDVYKPAMTALEYLYDKVVKNG